MLQAKWAIRQSDWYDILGLETFLTLRNGELDLLTFKQGFETRA
jgi:hypothetical protein|tara:strand:- start:2058 stop:2189 length:132 start_codon:yes stop_codon:yes gene_type:complete